jgi:hypothetical protein
MEHGFQFWLGFVLLFFWHIGGLISDFDHVNLDN